MGDILQPATKRCWKGVERILSKPRRDRIESEIVILDTESDFNKIKSISIPFDENVPEFYAISYRWGRHVVWKAQTPNYEAFITSVSQGNLIKLCKYYRPRIRYIWIDVVCINQADKNHRKMAIKMMNDIYRKARRIIAVPDLCYCAENPFMQNVIKEDIERALFHVVSMGENELYSEEFHPSKPGTHKALCLDVDDSIEYPVPRSTNKNICRRRGYCPECLTPNANPFYGREYIQRVSKEWGQRAWVISERLIGLEDDKLLIHILRANAVVHWGYWRNFDLTTDFQKDDSVIVQTILESKSTKPIDRLFAILPHTKYKYAVQKLLDEETVIDEEDLGRAILDILGESGRKNLLACLIQRLQKDVKFSTITYDGKRIPLRRNSTRA